MQTRLLTVVECVRVFAWSEALAIQVYYWRTAQHSIPAQHRHSTAQHSTAQHSTATAQHRKTTRTAQHSHRPQHSTAQHSTAQHSTAIEREQHSTAQHSTYHSTATAQHNAAQRTAQAQDLDQRDVKASQLRPNMIESMQDTPIRNVVLSVCISFCVKLCTRKFS